LSLGETMNYGKREIQKEKREFRDMLQLRINYQIKILSKYEK
jgi:hypothetical protein